MANPSRKKRKRKASVVGAVLKLLFLLLFLLGTDHDKIHDREQKNHHNDKRNLALAGIRTVCSCTAGKV